MRKDEAVHLHALLREIRRYLESRGEADPQALVEYDALGISPLQVHRPKSRHIEAVGVLAGLLADELAANSKYADDDRPTGRTALQTNDES